VPVPIGTAPTIRGIDLRSPETLTPIKREDSSGNTVVLAPTESVRIENTSREPSPTGLRATWPSRATRGFVRIGPIQKRILAPR
jgi:hypothetical protein